MDADMPIPVEAVDLLAQVQVSGLPRFDRPMSVSVREARLLNEAPWVRAAGKLTLEVTTEGWKFPAPALESASPEEKPEAGQPQGRIAKILDPDRASPADEKCTRLKPPRETVVFKERLLYLLQPPLENLFRGKQLSLPFKPYPYQMEGIAFLMPRHAALLADEMGLGKTMQTILALRLLFHTGMIQRALLICPKPLVNNWIRELRLWAEDLPFEVIAGNYQTRKASWLVSKCPLKLINYELLTRDTEFVDHPDVQFDLVVLDEAQRIKNKGSKTATVVCSVKRDRSWALTGTPIENRPEDLINIFDFVDAQRIPPDAQARDLATLTGDYILRRVKEDVVKDMPPRVILDKVLDLSPAQREAYDMAEKEGVIRLNELGDTITVQHVFELVMRLKQICNFDPLTGQSAKLEQLITDISEAAESGRKSIVFSQWVEPLEVIARAIQHVGPLQFHGKIPHKERYAILDRFKSDPSKHVILMSYATGSVGLNLQFCNYVFLFDRWWNPAIEDQAINRAHRLGQKDQVFVVRYVSQGTIEERIAAVLEQKRQLFQEVIAQNGPPPALGLTQEEIFGLFDVRSRPRRAA